MSQLAKIVLLVISLLNGLALFSQTDSTQAKNLVFVEVFGIGGYGSVNYERIIPVHERINIGLRAGLSSNRMRDFENKFNPDILLPLSIGVHYGQTHSAEIAVGQTFTSMVLSDEFAKKIRENKLHTNFTLAYRYQKTTGGLFLKLAYTPIIEFDKEFKHWGGLSIGYAF